MLSQRASVPSEVLHIDPATNEIVARIPVEGSPVDIAVGADSVWVTSSTDNQASVLRIDPRSDRVTASIPIDGGGWRIVASDDAVWVAVLVAGSGRHAGWDLVRIDPATNQVVAAIPLGEYQPGDIGIADGAVWLSPWWGGDVLRVDPATNEVVASVPARVASGAWSNLAVGDDSVWVVRGTPDPGAGVETNNSTLAVRIDTRTNDVEGEPIALTGGRPDPLEGSSWPIDVSDGGLWVLGFNENQDHMTVTRLDLQTLQVDASVTILDEGLSEKATLDEVAGVVWVAYHEEIVRVDIR